MSLGTSSQTLSQALPKVWKVLRDPQRLEALADSALLDSPTEEVFDRFTRLASTVLNAPICTVSLVGTDHQFFKSQVGVAESVGRRMPLSHSFCQHVVASAAPLVVADAREHSFLRYNRAVHENNVIAYLGIPLTTREGHTLGSFCTIDTQPRQWSEHDVNVMIELAGFVMTEIELRLLARHFQANFIALRKLEMERDELVHMLVHDLRNPLSSLLAGLELIKDAKGKRQAEEYADLAYTAAESLLAMINDILDVSKSEAGRMELALSQVSPRALLERACGMVEEMAATAGVTLEIEADADLPLVEADGEKLRRILVNLISNAIQHTPESGRIEVAAKLRAGSLVFSVSDTGHGIPESAFKTIFEKFGASGGRQTGRFSTGLGLPFCKMAVEAHGGSITVESEIRLGTTFSFNIPLR